MPRLQLLNPNVSVKADTGKVGEKSDEYFTQFDVICATCCTTDTLVRNSPNLNISKKIPQFVSFYVLVCMELYTGKVFPIPS